MKVKKAVLGNLKVSIDFKVEIDVGNLKVRCQVGERGESEVKGKRSSFTLFLLQKHHLRAHHNWETLPGSGP